MRIQHQDRLATLVGLLDEKTRDSLVFWEETTEEGTYTADFGAYSLRVYKRLNPVDDKAQEDVCIGICDRSGKLLDEFTDLEIEASLGDAYERMTRIYQMARRRALGVDHAVENIIAQLKDTIDFEQRKRLPKGKEDAA